jgi:hypothetical protein
MAYNTRGYHTGALAWSAGGAALAMTHKERNDSSMPRYWKIGDADRLAALCDRQQADALEPYDHHRVVVGDCWGVLLTYGWSSAPDGGPLLAQVVFHPDAERIADPAAVRRIVQRHPPAPASVQALIDTLLFT